MSKQFDADMALICRYCLRTVASLRLSPTAAGGWKAHIDRQPDGDLRSVGTDFRKVIHAMVHQIRDRRAARSHDLFERAAEELGESQAILGDWSES